MFTTSFLLDEEVKKSLTSANLIVTPELAQYIRTVDGHNRYAIKVRCTERNVRLSIGWAYFPNPILIIGPQL